MCLRQSSEIAQSGEGLTEVLSVSDHLMKLDFSSSFDLSSSSVLLKTEMTFPLHSEQQSHSPLSVGGCKLICSRSTSIILPSPVSSFSPPTYSLLSSAHIHSLCRDHSIILWHWPLTSGPWNVSLWIGCIHSQAGNDWKCFPCSLVLILMTEGSVRLKTQYAVIKARLFHRLTWLYLSQKVALEHTTKAIGRGQLVRTFCVRERTLRTSRWQ